MKLRGELSRPFFLFMIEKKNFSQDLKYLIELAQSGKYREALKLGLDLLPNNSNDGTLLNTLGIVYRRLGNLHHAIYFANKALEKNPTFLPAKTSLASIYLEKGKPREAIGILEAIINQDPKNESARTNLAYAHKFLGNHKEALSHYRVIVGSNKNNFKGRFHLGITQITMGFFKEGWQQYEYRWKVKPFREVKWPFAREEMWNNEEGKRVSLWKEQGIGDEIIFLGLVPEAKERSQSLAVYIDPRLVPLCERSMPGIKFFGDTKEFEKQAFDYHMPMGSLPRLFRSDIKDFDRTAHGYLKADKLRVDILRREMGLEDKRVIGISWKSIRSLTTSKKSMMLKDFGMMFKGLDVVLLNLQYGDVQEEIDEFTQATGIEILQCESVDNREDLDGLAALIELCDLVVSTSNITIHLAGALGKETWVLVSTHGGIWWLLDRTDSIWYPALRLYRQKTLDDWGGVLSNINKDLKKKFGE